MVKIHWLGTGLSAIPGLKSLIDKGHSVVVYNRTVEKAAEALSDIKGDYQIIEFSLKDDDLGDPLIPESHILVLDIAKEDELIEIMEMTSKINDYLRGFFASVGIELIDFKLEFGRLSDGDDGHFIVLADEFSPDNCRLWDFETGEKLDKDRFRRDLGGEVEAYQEVARRLGVSLELEDK